MRVFVAGASGAIGTRLVPQLIDRGHEVIGTYRSPGNAERVRALGAEPVALDLLDAARRAQGRPRGRARRDRPSGDRAGGYALLEELRPQLRADEPAADRGHRRAAGRRARGGRAPVRRPELRQLPVRARGRAGQDRGRSARPRRRWRRCARPHAAMRYLDEAVTDAGGIALRYGGFYGAANDGLVEPVRKRQFPIVGDGGGVSSFIHLDDAAAATVLALEHGASRHLQHRRRRARPGARVAAGARRACSAPSRPATSPAGSRGCSRAKPR